MNKKIASLLISAVLIIIAVGALNNPAIVDACDNAILLEKRHPGYWDYLSPDKMIEVRTIPGFEEVSTEEIEAGNVLKDFYQGGYSGVDISYKDGEMHFEGTATEDIWPGIVDLSNLTSGTYLVSAGATYPSNATVYFEGNKDGKNQTLAVLNHPATVYIDTLQYDFFKFTVAIKSDEPVNFSIHPLLYKITDNEISTESINVWDDVSNDLSEDDLNIFERGQSGVIFFQDSSVKKYDGQWRKVTVDDLGRICST
jgi:hypothetical protein